MADARAARCTLFVIRFVSQASQGLFFASLLALAVGSDRSALAMSGVLAGMTTGALVFGIPGGALVDRAGARTGFVAGAFLRFLTVAFAAALVDGPVFAAMIALVYSMTSQIYSPAEMALIPHVEEPGRSSRTHSTLLVLQVAGQGSGWLMAPFFLAFGSNLLLAMAAAVACGLVVPMAALLSAQLRGSRACRAPSDQRHDASPLVALRHFIADPRAAYAVVLLAFAELVIKSGGVALPGYLSHDMDIHGPALLAIVVPATTGALAAPLWASRRFHGARPARVLRATLLGMLAGLAALVCLAQGLWPATAILGPYQSLAHALALEYLILVPVAFIGGVTISLALVAGRSVLTETTAHGQHGRIFASQGALTELVIVAPVLLGGVGTEFAGSRLTFLFLAVVGCLAFAFLEMTSCRQGRDSGLFNPG
jgi:MFS family permease